MQQLYRRWPLFFMTFLSGTCKAMPCQMMLLCCLSTSFLWPRQPMCQLLRVCIADTAREVEDSLSQLQVSTPVCISSLFATCHLICKADADLQGHPSPLMAAVRNTFFCTLGINITSRHFQLAASCPGAPLQPKHIVRTVTNFGRKVCSRHAQPEAWCNLQQREVSAQSTDVWFASDLLLRL